MNDLGSAETSDMFFYISSNNNNNKIKDPPTYPHNFHTVPNTSYDYGTISGDAKSKEKLISSHFSDITPPSAVHVALVQLYLL